MLTKINSGYMENPTTMKLSETVAVWLSQQIETTRQSYYYPMRDHINLIGGELPLVAVTPVHIATYSDVIRKRDYSLKTLEKHFKTVRTFWNWALKMDFIEKSPARVLKLPKVPANIGREKAMPDDDLSIFFDFLHRQTFATHPKELSVALRNYALFKFLADTGARAGGAASLQLQDVHLKELYAVVTEKGNKKRKVAFTSECAKALGYWIMRRPHADGNQFVFLSLHSPAPITANYIGQLMRRICKEIERDLGYTMQNMNPHSLRHRLGHKMWDARVAPSLIAAALGHEDIETAIRHYAPNDWESAADAIREQALSPMKVTAILPDNKILKLSSE